MTKKEVLVCVCVCVWVGVGVCVCFVGLGSCQSVIYTRITTSMKAKHNAYDIETNEHRQI